MPGLGVYMLVRLCNRYVSTSRCRLYKQHGYIRVSRVSLFEFLTVIFKLKNTEKSKGLKKEETLNSWMLYHPRGKQNKAKIENSDKYKDIKFIDYTNVHFSDHQYSGI